MRWLLGVMWPPCSFCRKGSAQPHCTRGLQWSAACTQTGPGLPNTAGMQLIRCMFYMAKNWAGLLWCSYQQMSDLGGIQPTCCYVYLCASDHVCLEVGGQLAPVLPVVQPLLPFLWEGIKCSICRPQHGERSVQGVTDQRQQLRILSKTRRDMKKKAKVFTAAPQEAWLTFSNLL